MNPFAHPLSDEWLMAYHDGELDPARRRQVEAHLPECAACRQTLAELGALSLALAAADLPTAAGAQEFWQRVQPRLPPQPAPRARPAPLSPRQVVLRWLPGIGLLLLNGAVQVFGLGLTLLLLGASTLAQAPAWTGGLGRLAGAILGAATLGWLGWLVPADWSGWLLIGFWLLLSVELAVLYLAWLGYELRHGPRALFGRALA